MWSNTSLSHCVIFLHTALIASDEVFGNVLMQFDGIVSKCVAVPEEYISKIITDTNLTHNAIDSIFAQSVCKVLSYVLFSVCVEFAFWFVHRFV